MVSNPLSVHAMDSHRFRLKNRFPFENLRHQLLSPFRTQSPTPKDRENSTLQQSRPYTAPQPSSRLSIRIRSASDPNSSTVLQGLQMTLPRNSRPSMGFLSPQARDFAHANWTSDSLSAYSDAAGEPLVNDASSEIIPKSARPLIHEAKNVPERNRSVSPRRMSRISLEEFDPPDTPEFARHRVDSAQSKTE